MYLFSCKNVYLIKVHYFDMVWLLSIITNSVCMGNLPALMHSSKWAEDINGVLYEGLRIGVYGATYAYFAGYSGNMCFHVLRVAISLRAWGSPIVICLQIPTHTVFGRTLLWYIFPLPCKDVHVA